MRIQQLSKIDYNDHWLVCTRYGDIRSTPKDPIWLRWIKSVFQVLTFYFYDVFGHVRVNRVALGLLCKYKEDLQQGSDVTDHYIVVINKLLSTSEHPIRTHREELIRVKNTILELQKKNEL